MNGFIAQYEKISLDPLISVVSFRIAVEAMRGEKPISQIDFGFRSTKIAGTPLIGTISSQKLSFNGDRKILILQHGFGVLRMKHGSTISKSPTFTTGCWLTDKPVFHLK